MFQSLFYYTLLALLYPFQNTRDGLENLFYRGKAIYCMMLFLVLVVVGNRQSLRLVFPKTILDNLFIIIGTSLYLCAL